MMAVGQVRVSVAQPPVDMAVAVRFARRVVGSVGVLVVIVVAVTVAVFERRVLVLVRVALGQVKPDADAHERAGGFSML